jgi:hypothetical protein
MPKEYTFPPKLKLIFAHLKAVRALNDYVSGVEMEKDIKELSNHLRQELSRSVLRPAGWKELEQSKGVLYSSPTATSPGNALLQKWEVIDGRSIAIAVEVVSPVHWHESYVELWIPEAWKKREEFRKKIRPLMPRGFEHFNDSPAGELTPTTSIFKYIPYEHFLGSDGVLDGASFLDAFRDATAALVHLENDIDGILVGFE